MIVFEMFPSAADFHLRRVLLRWEWPMYAWVKYWNSNTFISIYYFWFSDPRVLCFIWMINGIHVYLCTRISSNKIFTRPHECLYSALLLKRLIVCYFTYQYAHKYLYTWKTANICRIWHSQGIIGLIMYHGSVRYFCTSYNQSI